MYLIHPKRDVHIPTILPGPTTGIKGEVRAVLKDLNGRVVYDSGFEPNVLTNNGLEHLRASDGWSSYCAIGDGSTPAAVTDTTLAGNNLGQYDTSMGSSNYYVQTSTPFEVSYTRGWRWNAGTGPCTVREAVCYPINNGWNNITSRVVLSTPVVMTIDNVLEFYWRFTMYPYLGNDTVNNVDIPLDGVTDLYNVTSCGVGYYYLASPAQSSLWRQFGVMGTLGQVTRGYSGPLTGFDPATNNFSGTGDGAYPNYWSHQYGAYQFVGPDTGQNTITAYADLDAGNTGAGIKSLRIGWDHNYTHGFNFYHVGTAGVQAIPKDNTRVMSVTFLASWTRI